MEESAAEHLDLLQSLGYMRAPVIITDEDHWSGFRPDKIGTLAAGTLVAVV